MRNLVTNDQDILFALGNGVKEASGALKKNLPRTSTYTLQEEHTSNTIAKCTKKEFL